MLANYEVPDISISMGDFKFLASPMILGNSDINLILGMDWLSKHKAQLDCAARKIQVTHSSEKGELDAISQIPVICEYQDVFPEELPRMPSHRPVVVGGIPYNEPLGLALLL